MTTTDVLRARIEGKPGVVGASIILRSGNYFDYLEPEKSVILVEDIAWGLSNIGRFGGQASAGFYSVAQHSVLVSLMVPAEHAFAALMHDAAEAFVGDMVGPLKQLCPDYKAIEKRVEAAVLTRFGIVQPLDPCVKHADLRALRTEQRDLTSGSGDNWNGLDAYEPWPDAIVALTPSAAFALFMGRFWEVSP